MRNVSLLSGLCASRMIFVHHGPQRGRLPLIAQIDRHPQKYDRHHINASSWGKFIVVTPDHHKGLINRNAKCRCQQRHTKHWVSRKFRPQIVHCTLDESYRIKSERPQGVRSSMIKCQFIKKLGSPVLHISATTPEIIIGPASGTMTCQIIHFQSQLGIPHLRLYV